MGSVSIIPATVVSVSKRGSSIISGWSSGITGTSTDAALIAAIRGSFSSNLQGLENQDGTVHLQDITFGFDQSTAIFTIDTGLVSFTNLPSGFLFDSLVFNCSPTGGSQIVSGSISFSLSGQLIQTYPYNGIDNFTHDLLNGRPSLAPVSFINEQFQFAYSLGNLNAGGTINNALYLGPWFLTGTYILFSFSWNIKDADTPIKQARGSLQPIRVTVQSPSDDPDTGGPNGLTTGGLDGIESITINYYVNGTLVQRAIPAEDIIIQENIILIFIINIIILELIIEDLNNTINTTTFYITATGNGIQFSGSVPLGNLSILLVDASGIYKITEDKRNDTLYSNHDGTTFDSAIPNPFVKGGFVGG